MDHQTADHIQIQEALDLERQDLFLERQELQRERERLDLLVRSRSSRRYRLLAFLVDIWSAWLLAQIICWVLPSISSLTVMIAVYLLAVVVLTKRFGQSLGKMAFELKVETIDRAPLDWGNVVLREVLGKFVSVVTVIGLFVPFFNVRQLAIHDYMTLTVVTSIEQRVRKEG